VSAEESVGVEDEMARGLEDAKEKEKGAGA
jgi:hypothetical protein